MSMKKIDILIPQYNESERDISPLLDSIAIQQNIDFDKIGVIICNDHRIDPMTVVIGAKQYPENIIENLQKEHKIYTINGLEIAKSLGNSKVLNSVVLGLSAKHIGFKEEDWLAVIEKTVPPKTIELNKTAFKCGYEK